MCGARAAPSCGGRAPVCGAEQAGGWTGSSRRCSRRYCQWAPVARWGRVCLPLAGGLSSLEQEKEQERLRRSSIRPAPIWADTAAQFVVLGGKVGVSGATQVDGAHSPAEGSHLAGPTHAKLRAAQGGRTLLCVRARPVLEAGLQHTKAHKSAQRPPSVSCGHSAR